MAPSVSRVDGLAGMESHRGELFATGPAAVGEDLATAAGGHACTEAVLALAADFRGLILAFHRLKLLFLKGARTAHRTDPALSGTRRLAEERWESSVARGNVAPEMRR